MIIEPLYDRVLLKRKEAEETSRGGIVLTTGSQEKKPICTVVAVGQGRLDEATGHITPLKVDVGMDVMIGKWSGDEVKDGDEDLLMVREVDIMAIVREV